MEEETVKIGDMYLVNYGGGPTLEVVNLVEVLLIWTTMIYGSSDMGLYIGQDFSYRKSDFLNRHKFKKIENKELYRELFL